MASGILCQLTGMLEPDQAHGLFRGSLGLTLLSSSGQESTDYIKLELILYGKGPY